MAKGKVSSYNKLKQNNKELIIDIHALVKGEFIEQLQVRTKWSMLFDLENIVWGK